MVDTQANQRRVLAKAYDAHSAGLFRYFLAFGCDESEARDALQDVFLKLAENPSILDQARSCAAVLFRIAHNHAVDRVRRREVRRTGRETLRREYANSIRAGELFFAPAHSSGDEKEFRQRLNSAFEKLPVEQASVVQLKLWQGLTFAEIAKVQGISQNTAGSRYRYGIDKLQTLLRPLYEEIR